MPSNYVGPAIRSKREDTDFGMYRFPRDLGPNALVLDFMRYSYDATFSSVNQTGRSTTEIILPLPQQLVDVDSIDVGAGQLGTVGALAVGTFSSATGGGLDQQISNALDSAKKAGANLADNITSGNFSVYKDYLGFAARNLLSLSPELSLAADVATGTAINPHTTLNFDGVGLKEFTFGWQLAPRNNEESDLLKDIIAKIKSHILPKTVGFGDTPGLERAILKYPDIAKIRLNGVAKEYFPQLRPGMISNFTVDYTPQGNVLVEGGKPAIVNLSFTFQEAQIRTSGGAYGSSTPYNGYYGPNTSGEGPL